VQTDAVILEFMDSLLWQSDFLNLRIADGADKKVVQTPGSNGTVGTSGIDISGLEVAHDRFRFGFDSRHLIGRDLTG
jgi:hypothetical protein